MIEQAFENLRSRSLVDWGVVLFGARAEFGGLVGRLDGETVEAFAIKQLPSTQPEDPEFEDVTALSLNLDLSTDEIVSLVENICQAKNLDMVLSLRKWRAALIEDALVDVGSDPLYGLIRLSEIWSAWGWPDDAPKSMQKDSGISSGNEYGSPEEFIRAKRETEDWLSSEYAVLKSAWQAVEAGDRRV